MLNSSRRRGRRRELLSWGLVMLKECGFGCEGEADQIVSWDVEAEGLIGISFLILPWQGINSVSEMK